jgi:hypothetical protein
MLTWYDVLGALPKRGPRDGEGLDRPEPVPSGPGGELYGRGINADMVTAALADLMTPHPAPARRVIVPGLCGRLFRPYGPGRMPLGERARMQAICL